MDRESISGGASRLLFFAFASCVLLLAGLGVSPSAACETVSEGRSEATWTLRIGEDQPWSLQETCAAALDELAALMVGRAGERRREVISIEMLIHGARPTSLLLARMAALASRIEAGLLERGVRKPRIRMREFRMPEEAAGEFAGDSRIIVRVGEP